MAEQLKTEPGSEQSVQPAAEGISLMTLLLSLVLLVVSLIWVQHSEMISQGVQLTESVPVVPAVSGLLLLTLLLPLLGRLPGTLRLTRAGVLLVYVFLCIATSMSSTTYPIWRISPNNLLMCPLL